MRILSFILNTAPDAQAPIFSFALLFDLGHDAGAYRAATFANREALPLIHRDRCDQFALDSYVVARHDHLGTFRQRKHSGDVGGLEIKLRAIAVEERGVASAFILGQDVDRPLEFGVRRDRAGGREHLAALDLLALDAAQQHADVVARLAFIEQLAKHLDAGNHRLGGIAEPDDLNFLANLDLAAINAPGHHRAAPGDREHVLDRHQERLVDLAFGLRDVFVHRVHQIENRFAVRAIVLAASAIERLESAAADNLRIVAWELVLGQQVADFQFDQVQQFGIIDHVDLVHEHHDRRHSDLAREQDVLPGLRHGPVVGAHHQDRTVHLGGAGYHVLDVVGVARAIDVRIVALGGLVLDVRDRDGNTALALLGGLIDLIEGGKLGEFTRGQHLGNRGG